MSLGATSSDEPFAKNDCMRRSRRNLGNFAMSMAPISLLNLVRRKGDEYISQGWKKGKGKRKG